MTAPRLHVLTATESPRAVVLRRGPSRAVAALAWDRETGAMELGQWMRGRIYEHRSDLSPDGRHLIYFGGTMRSIAAGRWFTAISRAPWLRAIVFLPQDHTWHGGGAFTADGRVFLNGGGTLPDNADKLRQAPPDAFPHGTDGFHMGGLFVATMVRRGWSADGVPGYGAGLWRDLADGWRIELTFETGARNRSIIANRYALVLPGRARVEQPDWEWAERWGDGLQFAAQGGLWFARIGREGALLDAQTLHDLSPMAFEARDAPYPGVTTGAQA